jgi:hypothetical protein
MDRKALEWMGERVNKGKDIVRSIEALEKFAKRIEEDKGDFGVRVDSPRKWCAVGGDVDQNSRAAIAKAAAEAARKEIERLEQELAEL